MHEPERVLRFRRRARRGAIMRPKTFERIVRGAMRRYGISRGRAEKVAGATYWRAAEARARGRKRRSKHRRSR